MPPGRGKWPPPNAKALRRKPAAFRNRARDIITAAPAMGPASSGFSMRDEARNTASHQSSLAWSSGDAKLRQKPVTFVSAGFVEPLKEEERCEVPCDVPSDAGLAGGPATDAMGTVGDTAEAEVAGEPETEVGDTLKVEMTSEAVEEEPFTTNLASGEQAVGNANQPPEMHVIEENELFFFDLGEDEPVPNHRIPPPKIPSPRSSFGGSDSSEEIILFRGRSTNPRGTTQRHDSPRHRIPVAVPETVIERKHEETTAAPKKPDPQSIAPPTRPLRRPKSQPRRPQATRPMKDDDEDEILADYIANMTANSDDDFIASQLRSFSTYRDIGGDDEAVNFGSGDERPPKDDDSMDNEFGIADAEGESFMAGNYNREMDADMDDETLARLLAKQEELGMGGGDLLLFTSSFARTGTKEARGKRPANASSTPNGRPSATQVADAFDNLGLDDWRQLTGQSRIRRGKQPPNFNVSDSEIEAALRSAWQRDRERKKSRKLEREAFRAKGLLGKNVDPDDLRIKYPSGLKLDDIKAELTSFLLGSAERLDFPPLDKHARKMLHDLANKLNIKSQSTGQGDQRRPVLYRTNRTARYTSAQLEGVASHVDQAAVRIHRKYFHRVDVKTQRTGSPINTAGSRSGYKALTLREGEVVGGSVPELGQENKGRTMLEKMGWSKGMALGALDNKGILEPVAQVMKRSKAGLG